MSPASTPGVVAVEPPPLRRGPRELSTPPEVLEAVHKLLQDGKWAQLDERYATAEEAQKRASQVKRHLLVTYPGEGEGQYKDTGAFAARTWESEGKYVYALALKETAVKE